MKLRTIYRTLWLAVLSAGLLAAMPGCTAGDDAGMDAGESMSDGTFYLTVTVVAGNSVGTRADADHEDDSQEPGSDAENYIDFSNNDFQIILFDKNGNYLHDIDGSGNWSVFPHTTSSTSNSAYYQMECKIEFPSSVTKDQINKIKTEGMQVMVLANWKSHGKNYTSAKNKPLETLWRDDSDNNFELYNTTSGTAADTWQPGHTTTPKKLIPMFGYVSEVKFTSMDNSGVLRSQVTIPMQRAVAKIEVIDNLEDQPSLSVDGVTMTKYNTSGRFIPNVLENHNWSKKGQQVDVSSLPTDVETGTNLKFFHDETNKWIAYVPEMALPDDGLLIDNTKVFDPETDAAKARPHLEVKIEAKGLNFYTGGTYDAHFAKYNDKSEPTIPDNSWKHILRNHIYRFFINKVGLTVQLHLHVVPWVLDDDEEWDFTDHVTVKGNLKWKEDTYESITSAGNKTNNDVVLLLDGTVLKGSFTIGTPRNGRWYARLIPIGDAKPNAVSFVSETGKSLTTDGTPCMEVSGIIDGNEQYLYILPTNFNNDDESRFKLDFWVENLGVWMNVPMPDGPYTIVRKGNLIIS